MTFLSVVVTHLEVEEHLPRIVAFVKEVQVIWRKKEVSAFSSTTIQLKMIFMKITKNRRVVEDEVENLQLMEPAEPALKRVISKIKI